ncbi:MAG: InlB B-repeat-containing protein [Oscillospiraceae bacterium]|nr:InlB B-repeat-containing protein [Oscillospiraceae bacterium]
MKLRRSIAMLMAGLVVSLLILPIAGTQAQEPDASSISGALWVDGNGMLPTDWNGLRDEGEPPLAGYSVALYAFDDREEPIDSTVTDEQGEYIFEGVASGSYVLGLVSGFAGGNEYLLPMAVTQESVFAIDWQSEPLTAWSAEIVIAGDDEAVTGMDAGMRLPMGIVPLAGEFVVSGAASGVYDSLADAISAVNAGPAGTYTVTVGKNETMAAGPLVIDAGRNVTLQSSGGPWTVMYAGSGKHIKVEGQLTLKNLTLDGANNAGGIEVSYGGAQLTMEAGAVITHCRVGVNCYGNFVMNDGLITENVGFNGLGVSINNGASFTMYDGEISRNVSNDAGNGGGVYNNYGMFTMHGGRIIENQNEFGGGVYSALSGSVGFIMHGGEISDNVAFSSGGGVRIGLGGFEMHGGEISRNQTGGGMYDSTGGGIYFSSISSFTMTDGEITGNNAIGGYGGGFAVNGSCAATLSGGAIYGNEATAGGGIRFSGSYPLNLDGVEIYGNKAEQSGGGILNNSSSPSIMSAGRIYDNEAVRGGGLLNGMFSSFTMNGGEISENRAQGTVVMYGTVELAAGGGVYNEQRGSFTMNGGEITRNESGGDGGGVYNKATFDLYSGGKITDNTAAGSGGGVYAGYDDDFSTSSTFTMHGGEISGNIAGSDGGGVYAERYNSSSFGYFFMDGGLITGNTAGGDGGAIFSGDYDYGDPSDPQRYSNIGVAPSAVVSGNTAQRGFLPPINAVDFTNRSTNPFDGDLMTNHEINYRIPSIKITYKANGGGGLDVIQDTGVLITDAPAVGLTIKTQAETGFTAPMGSGAAFLGWNTQSNGLGTHYDEGQTPVSLNSSIILYAQWDFAYRYVVTKDSDGSPAGSYHWLQDAVDACGTDGAYTITLTGENDDDMTDRYNSAGSPGVPVFVGTPTSGNSVYVAIPSGKSVTLTSDEYGPYYIRQQCMNMRHFVVEGDLTLANIELAGVGQYSMPLGGVDIAANASLTMEAGSAIRDCNGVVSMSSSSSFYGGYGGGVFVESGGAFTMNGGEIKNCMAQADGGGVFLKPNAIGAMTGGVIRDTRTYGSGGGIYLSYQSVFVMDGGEINDTHAYGGSGGGVNSQEGSFSMNGGLISESYAYGGPGGGVYVYNTDFVMTGGTITDNCSYGGPGGGVSMTNGDFSMSGGEVSNNITYNGGGGVYLYEGDFAISGSAKISDNYTTDDGGGVFVSYGDADISGNAVISGNTAEAEYGHYGGGGVYLFEGDLSMSGGTVSGNTVGQGFRGGGGILVRNSWIVRSSVTMTGGTISGNTVGENAWGGGGIYVENSDFVMSGGSITGNSASEAWGEGGGVLLDEGSFLMQGDADISGNDAACGGGGLYACNTIIDMQGGTISGNSEGGVDEWGNGTSWGGGGVMLDGAVMTMSGGSITGNSTQADGGGVYAAHNYGGELIMTGGSITGNSAPDGYGGGIYTGDYWDSSSNAYANPVNADEMYRNITIGPGATVSGNSAFSRFLVPSGIVPGTGPLGFDLNLLNNDNINWEGDVDPSRYLVYKDAGWVFIGDYFWLADAMDHCGTDGPYTIVATQNDQDLSDTYGGAGDYLPPFLQTPAPPTIPPSGVWAVTVPSNKTVTFTSDANGTYVITQRKTFHFIVNGGLTLDGIVLSGGSGTAGSVTVNTGASLTMEPGAVIRDCLNVYGGGVMLSAGGDFVMNGGEIKNCTAGSYGGGVYANGGTFTMYAGVISGNFSNGLGGGVYMDHGSVFNMHGGAITGNEAPYWHGGGVSVNDTLNQGTTFTMTGGSIDNNWAYGYGGGVYNNSGDFNASDSFIDNNISASHGGGVYNYASESGTITLTRTSVSGNEMLYYGHGGGIYNESTDMQITDCVVNNNITPYQEGGGIYAVNCALEITDGEIKGNSAQNLNGGGISAMYCDLEIAGTEISGNSAPVEYGSGSGAGGGGGIYALYCDIEIRSGSTISNNAAGDRGGGVCSIYSDIDISDSFIDNNTAVNNGGGVFNANGSVGMIAITRSSVSGNEAGGDGGGVNNSSNEFRLTDSVINGNKADSNGGGLYNNVCDLYLNNCTITGNTAGVDGGGLWDYYKDTVVSGGTISGNRAGNHGGGVEHAAYSFTLRDGAAVTGNTAAADGGGIYNRGPLTMLDGDVSGNEAGGHGGGMYVRYDDFIMTGGSITGNSAPNGDGGGIFAEDYDYNDPVDASLGYTNLSINYGGGTGLVSGNTSRQRTMPPQVINGPLKFNKNLLDNHEINHTNGAEPTTLTVTKTAEGLFADLFRVFPFTIYLTDGDDLPLSAGKELPYTGSATGTLVLDGDGKAAFGLAHGQSIIFDLVPLDGKVRIVEFDDPSYAESFIDSEDGISVPGSDTGLLEMTADRSFAFHNQSTIIVGGIEAGSLAALFPLVLILLAGAAVIMWQAARRRRGRAAA